MLTTSRLIAMLPTARPEAARRFYGETLGLTLTADHPQLMIFEDGPARLHLQKVAAFTPQPFTCAGWIGADFRACAGALAARGVVFERFPGLDQDPDGLWTPPGSTAAVCWFKDPDGNLLSLSQG